jgi:ribosomal protein S18 acetylase RimI-like enzyme
VEPEHDLARHYLQHGAFGIDVPRPAQSPIVQRKIAPSQVPIGQANWFSSWLAISGEEIVGVVMTRDEWLSDLWVRRDSRGTGIGRKLLARAEEEIRGRGHDTIRLRVVKTNTPAVDFYRRHGWRVQREFPHEKYGHMMLEMTKSSETPPASFSDNRV